MNYSLIYVSTVCNPLDKDALELLAANAQKFNQEHGLTGLLLYTGDHFLQMLEGDYHELTPLFERIEKDDRHHSVEVVLGAPATKRNFPDWSMGVLDVSKSSKLDHASMRYICDHAEGQPDAAGDVALKMLDMFRFDLVDDSGSHSI